ncbi:MAG: hypothetical protein EXS36_01235 [Pedosphaera sp.]|nr:hypothetical protein [Pedosphaera sp.]
MMSHLPQLAVLWMLGTALSCSFAHADVLTLGNTPATGGILDSWSAIMVVDERKTYTNTSGSPEDITLMQCDILIGSARGRFTPFVARVVGPNQFIVVALGKTRVAGADYSSIGAKSFPFGDAPVLFSLRPGETIAPGFSVANPDGTGGGGSVVPYTDGGNPIWLTGGPQSANAGRLIENAAPQPAQGGTTFTTLKRTYAFRISGVAKAAGPSAPTDILIRPLDLFPTMLPGSVASTLRTADPNPGDIHTYTLLSNPSDGFVMDGSTLRTAAPLGPIGTSYSVRIRSTDPTERWIEKEFTLTVTEPHAPSALVTTADQVMRDASKGMALGRFATVDANFADAFVYTLVAGIGDADNALFEISGDALSTGQLVPAGRAALTIRVRSTDRAGLSIENVFSLAVLDRDVQINEFLAINDGGLKDEEGTAADWIELHNPLNTAVNLSGWRLTDDPNHLDKWIFPARVMPPDGYLVVFASGKDRKPIRGNLHTNFRIGGSGGTYLALVRSDESVVDLCPPGARFVNLAFGRSQSGGGRGFMLPTPGVSNGPAFAFGLNEVRFGLPRGYFVSSQILELTATIPGSTIHYTTDGTKPTSDYGLTYMAPLVISPDTGGATRGTRRIRAVASHREAAGNHVATHTYLFVNGVTSPSSDGIVGQTNSNSSAKTSAIKRHPVYRLLMSDALLSLPAISINDPSGVPTPDETETSIELISPAMTEPGFQIDCGIQAVGAHSLSSPKNNLRLYFRSEYGRSKLHYNLFKDHSSGPLRPPTESFDRLSLRSGSHDSFFWMAAPGNPPMPGIKGDALYLRASVMDDLHLAMDHIAPHGRFTHVFVNGAYHGLYQLREYPDEHFLASYLPGGSDSFDWTNAATPGENGSPNWQTTWKKLKAAAATSFTEAARWINLTQLADYMILNFWAGNVWDWNPNQNWMAAGPNRPDGTGWIFFSYDNDVIWNDPSADVTSPAGLYFQPKKTLAPDGLVVALPGAGRTLMDFPEFRILFRDRFYKACYHGGALDTARAQSIFNQRASQIRAGIVAETARWQPDSATSLPWDRDQEWETEVARIRDRFIPTRCATMLRQIRARGWYPLDAPEFSQEGGAVPPGSQPPISIPPGTVVYATLDGSDPRLTGGAIHPNAIALTEPLPGEYAINGATLVRLRARRSADGEWSPLNEARFYSLNTVIADASNIVISKIHYHPAPPDSEFIELMNISDAPVDASGTYFKRGVDYILPAGTVLPPGQRLVVREAQFLNSTTLNNGGERITLMPASGVIPIKDFTYGDITPWPLTPDGAGTSLVLIAPQTNPDPGSPFAWKASSAVGGSPGTEEGRPFHGVATDDSDGDGVPAIIEYIFGTSDLIKFTGPGPLIPSVSKEGCIDITLPHDLDAADGAVVIETSADLRTWILASPLNRTAASGAVLETWRARSIGPNVFARLKVILNQHIPLSR